MIKVVSFAAGSNRVGALADYVTKDRVGGVFTEDEDGVVLNEAALAARLGQWKEGFSGRASSKDIATMRFEVRAIGKSREEVEDAVGQALSGHHHALRARAVGAETFEISVVVAAEGRFVRKAKEKTAKQARFAFDAKFELFIAGRVAGALGDRAEVDATVTGISHRREGAVHALSRLVGGGPAIDETGRAISSVADLKTVADAWKSDLGSRKARDVMHLVVSAKAGTDPETFRATARELLASAFENRQYFFAVHSDRGHLHAHAVILVKGEDGQRLRPDISTFKIWRACYAEIAQSHGINMVATRRLDTASPPPFKQGEAEMERRGIASEHVRRKIEAKRANAVHIPVRDEGRQGVLAAYQNWQSIEVSAAPVVRPTIERNLFRLATAVNLSHKPQARATASLPIEKQSATIAKATGAYLTNAYNRANKVLNRALPMLDGEDKIQATKIANTYLAALATQREEVSAIENANLIERSHKLEIPQTRLANGRHGKGDAAERTAALVEEAETVAVRREGQKLRTDPAGPVASGPNLPEQERALPKEQDLLIDRIAAKLVAHTRVHRE